MLSNCMHLYKFANYHGYSDIVPYEIVRHVSEKTLEIREMKAVVADDWKPDHLPGGFSGVCINQNDQKWFITSDPSNCIIRIRLSKKGWGKGKFNLSGKPCKFHDYNF